MAYRNAVRLARKFLPRLDRRAVEETRFLRCYIAEYEAEHRAIYENCRAAGKLVDRSCPICYGSGLEFFIRNTTGAEYRLCRRCDLVLMSPILDPETLDRVYTRHDSGSKKMFWEHLMRNTVRLPEPPPKPSHQIRILKKYKEEGRLLDFGASYGELLNQAKFYYDAVGIEIDPITSRYAREELGLKVYNKSIFDEDLNLEGEFDLVTMLQVIEHLEAPRAVLMRLKEFLKNDGYIFIECPNYRSYSMRVLGKHHTLLLGNEHVNMFSRHSLTKLLDECGFEVVASETYDLDLHIYDLVGKCLSPVRRFHHRYSCRNGLTLRLFACLDLLYTGIENWRFRNDKDFGSYVRVLAKAK